MSKTVMQLVIYNITSNSCEYKVLNSSTVPESHTLLYMISDEFGLSPFLIYSDTLNGIITGLKSTTTYTISQWDGKENWVTKGTITTYDNINSLCASDFEKYINSSLQCYYKVLQYEGKNTKLNTVKLLLLDVIENLLYGELSSCLSIKDTQIIDSILNKIYGSSCMFPYPIECGLRIGYKNISPTQDTKAPCDIVVDPITTSYWKDDNYWIEQNTIGQSKIWYDDGCIF